MMNTLLLLSCMMVCCLSLPFPLFNMKISAERSTFEEIMSNRSLSVPSEMTFNLIDMDDDNFIDACDVSKFSIQNIPDNRYGKGQMQWFFINKVIPFFDKDGDKMLNLKEFLAIGGNGNM